jgi:hypothetical protein
VKHRFAEALQHPDIKGDGHVSPIDSMSDSLDVLSAYQNKNNASSIAWYTSFGYKYPGWVAIATEEDTGKNRLFVCGGHARLDRDLVRLSRDANVENLDCYHYKFSPEDTVSQNIRDVKTLQITNHRAIASDLISLLKGDTTTKLGLHVDFNANVTEIWKCFYNTVRKNDRKIDNAHTYTLSQGLFDLDTYVETKKADDPVTMYMMENESNISKQKYTAKILNATAYFPIDTGTNNESDDKQFKKKSKHAKIHHMGHGSIRDVNRKTYRRYDNEFKSHMDITMNRRAYSISLGESNLRISALYITEIETRDMSIDDIISNTIHLEDNESVSLAWSSPCVRLVFEHMTEIIRKLRDNGLKDVNIIRWIEKDIRSDYYITLPIGLLRQLKLCVSIGVEKKEFV